MQLYRERDGYKEGQSKKSIKRERREESKQRRKKKDERDECVYWVCSSRLILMPLGIKAWRTIRHSSEQAGTPSLHTHTLF